MTPLATVLDPGAQTTIQDGGRPGLRHLGIPLSGAVDSLSYALANAAAGAPAGAPALECAMTGPALRFERETVFAIGGADMRPTLNDDPAPLYEPLSAKRDDILRLKAAAIGARAYIAFSGGVSGERVFNSASTYLPGMFGGHHGRSLRKGDVIASAALEAVPPAAAPRTLRPAIAHDVILRATPGPEFEHFTAAQAQQFFTTAFKADRRANRMGARLLSDDLHESQPFQMKSSPVFPGTVQYPPDGAPFLLLADAQTVGGYPRIAQVITADLPLAGQIRPGDRIWFRRTSQSEARDATMQREALLQTGLPAFSFY